MRITSPAFGNDQTIPIQYTADGQNASPPLRIEDLPPQTQELAIICEDPDAPAPEPFVHWVAYKVPPASELHEDIKKSRKVNDPPGMVQGQNSFQKVGYGGPAPPHGHGVHHYHFRVYALDRPLEAEPGLDHKSLRASMAGHILDSAEIVGTYERMR